MKFIIKKDILFENLNHASKAISSKVLSPILTGINFDLTEEGLYLEASDNEISIRAFIPKEDITEIIELGSVVIGARDIIETLRTIPDSDANITIEVLDGDKMLINEEFSGCNVKIDGMSSNEYPNLDMTLSKQPIIISNLLFKNIVNQTVFAAASNDSKINNPAFKGINFKINNNLLEVTATNTYRLSKKMINLDVNIENDINITIPSRNILEFSKLLSEDDNVLEMHILESKVLFKYNNIIFLSSILNASYPNVSIPETFEIEIECNFNDLYNKITRASIYSADREKNTIKLQFLKDEMWIRSNSPGRGDVNEKIDVICDKELEVAFSAKYMCDAIKSFGQDKVKLCFNYDIYCPIVIKSSKDESLIQFISKIIPS